MRKSKAKSTLAVAGILGMSMLFSTGPAGALPPPPPNPSDAQISGAAGAKAQAEQQVAEASAAVTQMNNQIEALNAQALAAADAYEVAKGQLELAKENQIVTADAVKTAGVAVQSAEDGVKQLAHDVFTQGNYALNDTILLSADGPQDLIDRSNMLNIVSESQFAKVDELRLAKVQQANADSAAKQAVLDTQAAETKAKELLVEMNTKVDAANAQMASLQSQKAQLDGALSAAQNYLWALEGQKQTYQQWVAQKEAEEAAAAKAAAEKAAADAYAAQQAAEAAAAYNAQQAAAQAAAAAAAKPQSSGGGYSAPAPAPAPAPAAQAPSSSGSGWVKPAGGTFTSCFCARWGTFHYGIDIANTYGTPIYAAASGVVKRAGTASGFGNAIYIQHPGGIVTVYGHMQSIYVSAGQSVYAGQKIAGIGAEGQSTGPHLHFEVTKGMYGTRIDPVPFLAQRGVYV